MGIGVFIGFIILIVILLLSPLAYIILKKIGWPKLGMVITSAIILFVLSCFFTNDIDAFFYSKKDVKKDLLLANLTLKNDFEIISNDVSGMPDRFQNTKLKISDNDKYIILSQISKSKDFKASQTEDILYDEMWSDSVVKNKVVYTDYLFQDKYVRESYYQEKDYVPIHIRVTLTKNSSILTLERIEK